MSTDPAPREVIQVVEFNDLPPERERQIWVAWLRHHGIDPNDVMVPGWIERWPLSRRVLYLSCQRDQVGRIMWDAKRQDYREVVHSVQLEAEPSPFPVTGRSRDRSSDA